MLETPITEAKNTFTALVHQVEEGEVVHLTRHGRPVAVILSEADYQRLRRQEGPRPDILGFVETWRAGLPADWQPLADAEVDTWRDRTPGPAAPWQP
ncbi:MAG: type II toxin-antitoxin system Phd/YefM family antitoxin [Pseudomonadota bacterium]